MMREGEIVHELDPNSFDRTGGYFFKRGIAYLIDFIVAGFIVALIMAVIGLDPTSPISILAFLLASGILLIAIKTVLETARGDTVGKFLMGLRVEHLAQDHGAVDVFMRNVSHIIPLISPGLDQLIGTFSAKDDRQKWTDSVARTIVVENLPLEAREIPRRMPVQVEAPERTEKVRLGFDQGYAKGNCPRCGAPYRILPPGNQAFDGLWNHRCTWCNYLIREGL